MRLSIGTRILLTGAMAVALVGCDGKMGGGPSAAAGEEHALVGVKAPDFDLAAQSGGERASLSEHAGKVVIVDFWATWCKPCKQSFPFYQSLVEKHGGEVVVLGIAEDDEPAGIEAFAEETGVKFPLAWDDGKSVAKSYDPKSMPTSYLIDRNGIVREVHDGFRDGDEKVIEAEVAELK